METRAHPNRFQKDSVGHGQIYTKFLTGPEYDTYDIVSYGNKNRISKDYEVVIINTKKNEVVDRVKISYCVKSLRWSPDDKKLGILTYKPKENNGDETGEPASPKGVLYIYDLKTKKLTKLMDCPDCFDFHFVE